MRREFYPEKHVPDLREQLIDLVTENGWVINYGMEHKLEYAENHGGRCWCDPENRRCPCPMELLQEDFSIFGGTCLCNLIMTEERLEHWHRTKENYKKRQELEAQMTPEEHLAHRERLKENARKAQETLNRMMGKKPSQKGNQKKLF